MNNSLHLKPLLRSLGAIFVPLLVISSTLLFWMSASPAFSKEFRPELDRNEIVPAIQVTPTTTATLESSSQVTEEITPTVTPADFIPPLQNNGSTLNFSLEAIDYSDTVLASPVGAVTYEFRVPQNWEIVGEENILLLDLSYQFRPLDATLETPGAFGDLAIFVNKQLIRTISIEEEFENRLFEISLPASAFQNPEQTLQEIDLIFSANFVCQIPHEAEVVVHASTSRVQLNYDRKELIPDLADYPAPLFQQSNFASDNTFFVLPDTLTDVGATNVIRAGAKLGQLTNNQLPISTTTDVELTDTLSDPRAVFDEHLVLIGQPDDYQVFSLLNETIELPVPFVERQFTLISQGPANISLDQIFSYIITVTNTTDDEASFTVLDRIPKFTQIADCDPSCQATPDGLVSWDVSLEQDETATFTLDLTTTPGLLVEEDLQLDNTVTLIQEDTGPVNVNTLYTTLSDIASPDEEVIVNNGDLSNYFFTYNGEAVAEEDGIIQEIISPWNDDRAVLIFTGLSEKAVEKASLALGTETQLPNVSGPVAFVQNINFPDEVQDIALLPTNRTFEDLGYNDRTLEGVLGQVQNYLITLPYGWQPNRDDKLDLFFYHSQVIDLASSSLSVEINRSPIASFPLTEETAIDGEFEVDLSNAPFNPGRSNRISVIANLEPLSEDCESSQITNAWLTIQSDSNIALNNTTPRDVPLDLANFPYPFNEQNSLDNVLFALPSPSTKAQWEKAIGLASILGASVDGDLMLLTATFNDQLSNEEKSLEDYHIIAIGRPTSNTFIQQMNNELPQPFIPSSDEIQHKIGDVVFRSNPDVALGLIELVPSLWNENLAFLATTGTTDDGVLLAVETTIARPREFRDQLVFVQNERIQSVNTVGLLSRGVSQAIVETIPEAVITQTNETSVTLSTTPTTSIASTQPTTVSSSADPSSSEQTETSSSTSSAQPFWLIPMIIGNLVAVTAIFAVAIWQSRRRKK